MLKKPALVNIFDPLKSPRFESPLYNSREIDDLVLYFDWFVDRPACQAVLNLLYSTRTFMNVTHPRFGHLRKENKAKKELDAKLNRMYEALKASKDELNCYDLGSLEHELLESAIAYCTKCIRRRIETLKESNDDIYLICWPNSSLNQLL